jgi:hypothetical protein
VHQGGDVGAFDGLERSGHGEIHVLSISPITFTAVPRDRTCCRVLLVNVMTAGGG